MGALERKDIITEDALAAPMVLTKELEKILAVQDQITAKSKEMSTAISSGVSTDKVKKGIQDLTDQQKEQLKVMDAISKESAKNTDSYRAAQIALQKLKDENKLALAAQDSWTKEANKTNSSLTQLEQALNKNRVAYAGLRNEQARHSDEGKKLLTIIQQQAKDQDTLRTSMVQAQHRVGSYNETLEHFKYSAERIAPALRHIAPEALEAGEAVGTFGARLFSIISSPITITLTAIAVVFGTVAKAAELFFKDTVEGQERAAQAGVTWSATLEVVEERMKAIGKRVADFFGIGEGSFSGFTTGLLAFMGMTKLAAEIAAKEVILNEEVKLQNDLRREEILLTTELAELTLAKDKAMFEARDKVRNSDQERFNQLRESVKLGKEARDLQLKSLATETEIVRKQIEAKGVILDKDKKAYELLLDRNVTDKVGFELLEHYASLQAKVFEIEDARYKGARRRQALEREIIISEEKRQNDADKGTQSAIIKQQETIYTQLTAIQTKIIGNQNFSVEQQIDASVKLADAQIGLADLAASKELSAARDAALGRVEIDGDLGDKLINQAKGDLAETVRLFNEEKEKLLKSDRTYQDQIFAIDEAAQAKRDELLKSGAANTAKIITDNYKYFADLRKGFIRQDTNEELAELDKRFKASEIGIIAYEKEKLSIKNKAANESIDIDLQEVGEAIRVLEKFIADKKDIDGKAQVQLTALRLHYSELELAKEEVDAQKKLDLYKRTKVKTIQLVNETINAVQALSDARYQAEIAASQARLDILSREHDINVKAAGDNKNAIAAIDRDYTKKLAVETEKQNAVKRKQAQFDKIASEFKVISSTAAGIAQAFEEFPYFVAVPIAIAIAAIAALQLEAIAAAPLPAYAEGTDNHPGGLAVVGHGRELVREPGRKPFIVSSPEVMNLARGTEVLTDSETTAALAMAGVARSVNGERQVPAVILQAKEIVDELRRLQMPDIFEQNGEILKAYKNRDGGRRIVRAKWTNQ